MFVDHYDRLAMTIAFGGLGLVAFAILLDAGLI